MFAAMKNNRFPEIRARIMGSALAGMSLLCAAGSFGLTPDESAFRAQVRADTEWLAGYSTRAVGTKEHDEAQAELLARLRAVPGVAPIVQEFTLVAPIIERCELNLAGGPMAGTHRMYPIWPDLARLKTTPEKGISGDLLYVGGGELADLPALSLKGRIAVMEMSDYKNWRNPFSFGASAVVLLGGPGDKGAYPEQQSVYWPRYYVPEGPLADLLRRGEIGHGTIHCDGRWDTVTARNVIVPVQSGAAPDAPPALALAAPYDSMSIVMGLAPGADGAVDAALLLNMLRRAAASPPPRALLFCFVDAYGYNQLGMRHLLAMLTVTPDDLTRQSYASRNESLLREYELAADHVAELGAGREALNRLWQKRRYRELQRCMKDMLSPRLFKAREKAGDLRLAIDKAGRKQADLKEKLQAAMETEIGDLRRAMKEAEEERQELQAELDVTVAEIRRHNDVLSQVLTRRNVTDETAPHALAAWEGVRKRVSDQLAALKGEMRYFEEQDVLRNRLVDAIGRPPGGRAIPAAYLIGLDLSDSGATMGAGPSCAHLRVGLTSFARDFTRWLTALVKRDADPFWREFADAAGIPAARDIRPGPEDGGTPAPPADRRARLLELEALAPRYDQSSFLRGRAGMITSPALSFDLPSVTWTTLLAARDRVDTPQDKAARLDWSRLGPQISATRCLLEHLFGDPEFAPEIDQPRKLRLQWRNLRGTVVTESIGETVARTPVVGMLVAPVGGYNNSHDEPSPGIGIRRHDFAFTGPDGAFMFPIMPHRASGEVNYRRARGYGLDERGRIVSGISDTASMVSGRIASVLAAGSPKDAPARVVAFECEEYNGPTFFDPRFLEPLTQYSVIDVMRGGTPKRAHITMYGGNMFALFMPETRWQVILRAGVAGNRMALLNIDPRVVTGEISLRDALSGGFGLREPLPSIPEHISARDFHMVDGWRMRRFVEAGIESPAVEDLYAEAGRLLEAADKAQAADDAETLQRMASSALATEIRAYEALRATGDDVTRAAIFLMILLVPFAVAMERLVFAFPTIGKRIGTAALIFAGMTLILWSFHPAFRITTQPIVIVLAFAILLLSLAVIVIVLRKFESDLEELRSGRAEAGGAQTGRGGVLASALWLGIANMRKRKVRTFLTGTTVVLITFALLCFSSSSSYQSRRRIALPGVTAPYDGVLVRLPGMSFMDEGALPALENLLHGDMAAVPRYWLTPSSKQPRWRVFIGNPATDRQIAVKSGLGLSGLEKDLTGPDRYMPDWRRFAEGGACYLSARNAAALGAEPGDKLLVNSEEVVLAGVFDSSEIEQKLHMLDGQSLLPLDYSIEEERTQADAGARAAALQQLAGGSVGLQPETATTHVSGDDMVVLETDLARRLGGKLRSIAVHAGSGGKPGDLAATLTRVLAFPVYYGSGEDVHALVSTPLIPRPPRKLLIPLIIAALIIFNTMINSVAERKGEIHIYTSLGLAPGHVGMLFLAEAMTYGLMGSIFGYVAGQGLAKLLTTFGMMGGITLNYSGTNVMMTMGLVLVVVLLSAVIPAVMAGKLATPSKDMRWRVPHPEDGVIRDLLPFTVTREAAGGLMVFIREYMDAHREGAIGHFSSADIELIGPAEGSVFGLRGTVWLAPYDLGVRQNFLIEVRPDVENICSIHIELRHGAGQMKTWWRLNHTFLGALRRQFLGWRRVKPERVLQYMEDCRLAIPA